MIPIRLLMFFSSLSRILRGQRTYPISKIEELFEKLKLEDYEQRRFQESILQFRQDIQDVKSQECKSQKKIILLNSEESYRIISEWEYSAVIDYLKTVDEIPSMEELSKRFPMTEDGTEKIVTHLKEIHLIEYIDGKLKVHDFDFQTSEDLYITARIDAHKRSLEQAGKALENPSLAELEFISKTFAIDSSKLPEAKKLIRNFSTKMSKLLSDTESTDIFHFGLQLYPVTEVSEDKEDSKDTEQL